MRRTPEGSELILGHGGMGDGPVDLRVEDGALVAAFGGVVHPGDAAAVDELLAAAPASPRPVLVRWLMPDGELRHLEVAVIASQLHGSVKAFGWDVTAHVRNQQVLEHLALHDPLTGLANRVLFEERVRDELRRRSRTEREVAVLFADLDGFKQVNDAWGHAAGDILLATLADRLRQSVRPGDIVARLGGDEFAICCSDLSDLDDAMTVANRIIDDVTTPVPIGTNLVRVSCAVGVALADVDEPADGAALIARADLAMYAAKSAGRERVAVSPRASEDLARPAAG